MTKKPTSTADAPGFGGGAAEHRLQARILAGGVVEIRSARVEIRDGQSYLEETLLKGIGRVRDVREGPDGFLYLAIDGEGQELTPVVRLEPVDR